MSPDPLPFSQKVFDEVTSYTLHRDADALPDGLTSERVTRLYHMVLDGHPSAVFELKKAISEFPSYPALKNYLSVAYRQSHQMKQAIKIEKDLYSEYPDYLFARVSLANQAVREGKMNDALAYLGSGLTLGELKPDVTSFHASEWASYYSAVAGYFIEAGHLEAAQAIVMAIQKRDPDHLNLEALENSLAHTRARLWAEGMERDRKKEILVKLPPRPRTTEVPVFPELHFKKLAELRNYGEEIPPSLINEFLALPRTELVADLMKIVDFAVDCGPAARAGKLDGPIYCLPVHALFMLSELRAEESIDSCFRFLEQHPDLIDYWFGDFVSYQPFMRTVCGNLPRVTDWILSPGIAGFSRACISEGIARLALIEPERRESTLKWFDVVLSFLLESPPSDNVLDTNLINSMVADLMSLRAKELAPLVQELFARNLVAETFVGTLDDVIETLSSPPDEAAPNHEPSMIEFYDKLRSIDNQDGDTVAASLPNPFESDYQSLMNSLSNQDQPAVSVAGRNDPCPCGSGKKFKKCCM